jgi:hypothetical protein
VALALRTVCGLSTAEIVNAFTVSEAAIVQRLTRARRKIAAAGIPYRVPADDGLGDRLGDVLAVIYLLFNEAYLCSAGGRPQQRDLTDDAQWLAALLARLMPTEPAVLGLLALIRLHRVRAAARFTPGGSLRFAGRGSWLAASRSQVNGWVAPSGGTCSTRRTQHPLAGRPAVAGDETRSGYGRSGRDRRCASGMAAVPATAEPKNIGAGISPPGTGSRASRTTLAAASIIDMSCLDPFD